MTDYPEPPKTLNLPPGRKVDDYTIVELIGKGGMGEVYLATDARKPATFYAALKILYPSLAKKSGDYTRRFLREARIAKQFNHPNLIQIYGCNFCDQEGFFYIAQEYIGGGSLRQLITNDTVLSEDNALRIGIGVAKALEASHKLQVVHRDIKPDNIMFTLDGTIKLTDWGIAKNNRQTALGTFSNLDLTMLNAFIGTPLYAPPEQLQNSRIVDIRADIYSLGATIYYALVGKPPLSGTTEMESLCVILTQPAPDVRKARPDVSEKTAATLAAMLAKDPEKRPQNPTALLTEFLEAAQIFSLHNDISMEELASGTGIRGINQHRHAKEEGEQPRPPLSSPPPEPPQPPVESRAHPVPPPAPPQRPPAKVPVRPFIDDLDATLSKKQTSANRQPATASRRTQQTQTPPPVTTPEPEPPPEPKLLPEHHDTTQTRHQTAPDARKLPLFWKLAMTLCLAGLAALGGWLGRQGYKYHNLLEQGRIAVEQKRFTDAQKHYDDAGDIKNNDLRWYRGKVFTDLIENATSLEAASPADWPEILQLYEKALAVEGFNKSGVATKGKNSARQNVAWSQLRTDIEAALQDRGWNRVVKLLQEQEQEQEQEQLPGLLDDHTAIRLLNLAETEISYRDFCRQAEESLVNNNPESAEACYWNALKSAAAIVQPPNNTIPSPLKECHQQAFSLAEATNPQKAVDGLTGILLQKAERLCQENQFDQARKTLEWFQNDVSTTADETYLLFQKYLSATTREKAAAIIDVIKKREDEWAKKQARQDYDNSITDGDKAMETGNYDQAITCFQKARNIAQETRDTDGTNQATDKLENAWSKKGQSLCQLARSCLDTQPPNLDDAEKYRTETDKCLQKLPDNSSDRTELQTQIDDLKNRLKDLKTKPLRQKYEENIAAIQNALTGAGVPDATLETRLNNLQAAVANLQEAFHRHAEIVKNDPACAKFDHLGEHAKLSGALVLAAEMLLTQSQKQDASTLELKFCQGAQQCLHMLLEDMPPGIDEDTSRKAQDRRQLASQEESFLGRLIQSNQHLDKRELGQAQTSLAEAMAMNGFSLDPRARALLDKIIAAGHQTRRDELLDQAQKHERNQEWAKAKEAYEAILKIAGYENDKAAMEGLARVAKEANFNALLDQANAERDQQHWSDAEKALLKAKGLHVRDDEIENLLNEVYQLWHDALLTQADALLTIPDTAKKGAYDEAQTLLAQAKSIPKNSTAVWQKWFEFTKNTANKAVADKQWPAINGLLALAEKIPGFQDDRQIHQLFYQARCAEGDRLLLDYQFEEALQQYLTAKEINGIKDDRQADDGLEKVKKAQRAVQDFDKTMNEFQDSCANCRPVLTYSKNNAAFLSCLNECWTMLKDFPKGNPATNKETQITTGLHDVLHEDAKYFVDDVNFLARPLKTQQDNKIAFLQILADCDRITGGKISALPDDDPLRTCVLDFFEQDNWPDLTEDQTPISAISWLRALFPARQPE